MNASTVGTSGVTIKGSVTTEYEKLLTPEALSFVANLHRKFNGERERVLQLRKARQEEIDSGILPNFLEETREVREGAWTVDIIPDDLQDRRTEITGPVDRKMIINALNSGAKVFMADLEDANSPTWSNCMDGQVNLHDAIRKQVDFTSEKGKEYKLNEKVATLKVRPRGWHLLEKHVLVDGEPISASIFDFGLYFFHNAKELLERNSGPYFYLPKLESHLEARLWNDLFVEAQNQMGIAQGTIKSTVLIETIMAAFEMEEILYELRHHMAGLNAGRWDYIFSVIKKLRNQQGYLLPDRGQVTMTVPFMSAYAQLLVKLCHKRGAHAIGGMSAFIPAKDEAVNKSAFEKVKADKELEAKNGYDGTWVAHPHLVPVAMGEFDKFLNTSPHQKQVDRSDVTASQDDLLNTNIPGGKITEQGVRMNINVALLYLESWLSGTGAAALYNLMEDAATAEISRAQLWQWMKAGAKTEEGKVIDEPYYDALKQEEIAKIKAMLGEQRVATGKLANAEEILDQLIKTDDFEEFLTLPAYQYID